MTCIQVNLFGPSVLMVRNDLQRTVSMMIINELTVYWRHPQAVYGSVGLASAFLCQFCGHVVGFDSVAEQCIMHCTSYWTNRPQICGQQSDRHPTTLTILPVSIWTARNITFSHISLETCHFLLKYTYRTLYWLID